MKKSLMMAVSAVGAASLALTGCSSPKDSSDTSSGEQYSVQGTVVGKWEEYECASHSLGDAVMEPMSYGDKGGTTGAKSSNSDSNSGSKTNKDTTSESGTSSDSSAGGTGLGSGSSPSVPPAKDTRGGSSKSSVSPSEDKKFSPAPDRTSAPTSVSKPVKVPRSKIPTGKPVKQKGYSPKWCETDYELFIENKNNEVFEQDVPYVHYAKCDKKETFDSCV